MFANVYRAMRDVGMPDPRRVDELELWEIAVLIGSDENEEKSDPYAHLRADLAYREAMAAFQAGEGPLPDPTLRYEWPEPSDEEAELMTVLASGSSFA